MRHHFRKAFHYIESSVTSGLTPEAKLDIQNYINERKVDETGGSLWSSVKWIVFGVVGLSMLAGLIYCIYQCFKSKNSLDSTLQANPVFNGGYAQNYPVGGGLPPNQGYTPSNFQYTDAQSRGPRGAQGSNFAQSVTWHLSTTGKGM